LIFINDDVDECHSSNAPPPRLVSPARVTREPIILFRRISFFL
jgi:hypothetical protein